MSGFWAGFLEISAMSIALAQSGGAQYKAGLLRIEPSGTKGVWGRKNASWRDRKKQRWAAVRESYMVVLEEMGEVSPSMSKPFLLPFILT